MLSHPGFVLASTTFQKVAKDTAAFGARNTNRFPGKTARFLLDE
jgi:hypothetical protein